MSGQVGEAIASFSHAVTAGPGSEMNQKLLKLAEAVASSESGAYSWRTASTKSQQ
jgi:hypothetical protein